VKPPEPPSLIPPPPFLSSLTCRADDCLAKAGIGEEAGWAPEPVWTVWGRDKFVAPPGNRTPVPRLSSP
jgi:hypothetical protein